MRDFSQAGNLEAFLTHYYNINLSTNNSLTINEFISFNLYSLYKGWLWESGKI